MAQINIDLETLKTARDNMKTALEEKGQTVTKDIRTYAEAISNISTGGSSDVKLFETIEEMQEDEVSDDDKLVYDTEDDVYETAGAGSGAGALTLSSSQPVKNAAMINNVIGKIADALFE